MVTGQYGLVRGWLISHSEILDSGQPGRDIAIDKGTSVVPTS